MATLVYLSGPPAAGKLLDVPRLRALLATHDPAPLHPDDLVVDSSLLTPREAARRVAAAIGARPA